VLWGVCIDTDGAEKQIEAFFQVLRHRIKTAGARHFEITLVAGAQTDVVDEIVGAAMLGNEIGAAAHRHPANLLDPGSIIDRAGRDRVTEFKRLPFKIEHRNYDGHGILRIKNGSRW
jgi:hypothetical protein